MSKSFGKVVLISTILAGAAAGSYAYLKKEGLIGGAAESVAKDIAQKVKADADELLGKERTYVELNPEAEEVPSEESFEPGIVADTVNAAEVNTIGSTTSEEFFNDEEEN